MIARHPSDMNPPGFSVRDDFEGFKARCLSRFKQRDRDAIEFGFYAGYFAMLTAFQHFSQGGLQPGQAAAFRFEMLMQECRELLFEFAGDQP